MAAASLAREVISRGLLLEHVASLSDDSTLLELLDDADLRQHLREFLRLLCAAARPHLVGPLPRISALTVASNLVAAYIVETQPGRTPGLAQEKQQVLAEAHAMAVLLEAILLCAAGQDDLALQDLPQPLLQAFLPQLCGFWVTWADWVPYVPGPGEELIVQ